MNNNENKLNAGDEIEVQIAPFGKFECHDGNPENEGLVQVVDDDAIDAIIGNFKDEVLVDIDHKCTDGTSSEAAAWITRLYKDAEKGLMATFKLTQLGADAVSERRYRFVSPVWYVDDKGHPFKLHSVAFTNVPNLPVAPMLNGKVVATLFKNAYTLFKNASNDSDGSLSDLPKETILGANLSVLENDAKTENLTDPRECSQGSSKTQNERSPNMDELKALLGLQAEATDEEIVGAVKSVLDELAQLKEATAEAEAEAFASENCNKGIEKDVLKNAYRAAPEVAKNMVASLKVIEQVKEPVCVAANAKEPEMKISGYAKGNTPEERMANYFNKH